MMPPYSLDTNNVVEYLRGRNPAVIARIDQTPVDQIRICSVVRAELLHGTHRSQRSQENVAKVLQFVGRYPSVPFDDRAAEQFGQLRAFLERAGQVIGPYDIQTAAIALAHGLTLVTHNTREFRNVPGLAIEDWQATP